ncbi:ashwin [Rhinophrynus dorsalis]
MAHVGGSMGLSGQDSELLLHPELLSRDFLLLSLEQKNIVVDEALHNKEKLTEIFVQHAMPLPQRAIPKTRWGRMVESKRGVKKTTELQQKSAGTESLRKRPLIVFDGSSTSTSIKVKKTENGQTAQRLHPSSTDRTNSTFNSNPAPRISSSTVIREAKLTTVSSHGHNASSPGTDKATPPNSTKSYQPMISSAVKLKRAAPKEESEVAVNDIKPTEAKKKIQHVTWP